MLGFLQRGFFKTPNFWYFKYGAQKEDKHWFSEFGSQEEFNSYLTKSRYAYLCTQFQMKQHHILDVLKKIPPLGGSMSAKLDNEIIRTWWRKVAEHAKESGLKGYQGIHEPLYHPVMGRHRIMVAQIRTEACYNYLCSMGVEVNPSGEIFLSEGEAMQYIQFQKIMEE